MFKKSKKHIVEDNSKQIVDFVVEEYRFLKSYVSLLNKVLSDDRQKYKSVYDFHVQKIADIMDECNLKIVELEGKKYDDGLSITPLNIEDFEKNDVLIVKQVIEPLIISTKDGSIIRSGTVMLEKIEIQEEEK